uniref:Uncharacterized protein n=1 Tax=Aegilops tauschii subsp. strangulata TaxID=200361 RepID=A0A453HYR2_AEGTS
MKVMTSTITWNELFMFEKMKRQDTDIQLIGQFSVNWPWDGLFFCWCCHFRQLISHWCVGIVTSGKCVPIICNIVKKICESVV